MFAACQVRAVQEKLADVPEYLINKGKIFYNISCLRGIFL